MAKALEKDEQKRRAQQPKTGSEATRSEAAAREYARRQAGQAALEEHRRAQEQEREEEQAQRQQADAPRKSCRFFLSKKGCRLGDACPNFHDAALLEQRGGQPPPAVHAQPTAEDLDILATVVSLLKGHGGEMRLNQLGSKLPPALKASKTLQKMKLKTFLLDYPELFQLPPSAPGFDTVVLVSQSHEPPPQHSVVFKPPAPRPPSTVNSPVDPRLSSLPPEASYAFIPSPALAIPTSTPTSQSPSHSDPLLGRQLVQLYFATSSQTAERLFGSGRELSTTLANLAGCMPDELGVTIEPQADHSSSVTLLVPEARSQWVKSTVENHLARADGLPVRVAVRPLAGSPPGLRPSPGLSPTGLSSFPLAATTAKPGSSPPALDSTGPQLLRLQFTIEASAAEELFGDVNSALRKTLANLAAVQPQVLRVQLLPRGLLSHVTIWLPDTGNAWLAGAAVSMLEEALRRVAASTATITHDHVDAVTAPSISIAPPMQPQAVATAQPVAAELVKPELEIDALPISLSSDEEDEDPLPAYSPFEVRPGPWPTYEAAATEPASFFGLAPAPAAAPRWLPPPAASLEPWGGPQQFGGFFAPVHVHSQNSPSYAPPLSLPRLPTQPQPQPQLQPQPVAAVPSPFFGPGMGRGMGVGLGVPGGQAADSHTPFGPGFHPAAGFFAGHSFYPPQEYPTARPPPNGSSENRDETNNYGQFGSFYWNPVDTKPTRQ